MTEKEKPGDGDVDVDAEIYIRRSVIRVYTFGTGSSQRVYARYTVACRSWGALRSARCDTDCLVDDIFHCCRNR